MCKQQMPIHQSAPAPGHVRLGLAGSEVRLHVERGVESADQATARLKSDDLNIARFARDAMQSKAKQRSH